MPNIASVLKEEIARLARKEVRSEIESLRKASTQHRSDLASLKQRVAGLEKQLSRMDKGTRNVATAAVAEGSTIRTRFSAKGLATHRQRLGLSAADLGTLLGVSAQSIYHWETGKTKPRQQQLDAIAALRKMGKREAKDQLSKLAD